MSDRKTSTKDLIKQHSQWHAQRAETRYGSDGKKIKSLANESRSPPSYSTKNDNKNDLNNTTSNNSHDSNQEAAYPPSYGAVVDENRAIRNSNDKKSLRKGHRIGDFFGAAFTGFLPKERMPAFETIEPRWK